MADGRNRTFEKEDALLRAMEVFWQKGYSGASLSDLTTAMGINKPSLYAAFGNKEALFVSAIDRYTEKYGVPHFEKLLTPNLSLRERLTAYLESIAMMLTDSKLPGGCFVATSTCEAGSSCLPEYATDSILRINKNSIQGFVDFFESEQKQGHIASDEKPEVLADYLLTLQFGLAVMARNGVKKNRLKYVIHTGMECF
jgi:AcrR family transcriptional regulator